CLGCVRPAGPHPELGRSDLSRQADIHDHYVHPDRPPDRAGGGIHHVPGSQDPSGDELMTTVTEDPWALPEPIKLGGGSDYVRNSRYYLPDPDNPAKEIIRTRATTYAKTISDTFMINQWRGPLVLQGGSMTAL